MDSDVIAKIEDSAKSRRKAPSPVLKSHTARVSKVLFAPTGNSSTDDNGEKKKAYCCGFDSTVRFWDGVCDHTIVIYLVLSLQTFLLT